MNFKLQQVGGVLLAMALVLATSCKKGGNSTQPTPKPNNVVRVEASVDALSARASLEPQSGSLNYQVKFTTNDNIQLYVKQNGTVHTIGSVKPTFVGQQRQVCHFEFTLPSSVTRSQQMTIIGVNGGIAKAESNKVYLTTNRITAPLASFTPPIAFVLEGANLKDAEVPVKAKFEHLGVYEAIHIKNESNQSVAFNVALVNEQGQQPWQRGENDVWVVSDRKFENRSSADKSVTDITIANGATDILYHWYLLADGEQSIPATMKLKGKVGAESNLLSVNLQSKAVGQKFQKGYIYHAYATYKGDGKLYFTDKEGTPKNVPVESVTLSETKKVLAVGDSFTLTPTILPAEATNKEVTWQTSGQDIATVENGKVVAKKAGVVTITATTKEGKKQATCQVVVLDKSADDVIGVEL